MSKRYLHSFLISSILYTSIFGSIIYLLEDVDFSHATKPTVKEKRIKIALNATTEKKHITKTTKPNIKKTIPKPKKKKKELVKKKIQKPKPKKIVKKKKIPQEKTLVQKKEKILKPQKQLEKTPTVQKPAVLQQIVVNQTKAKEIDTRKKEQEELEKLVKKQKLFLAQLREAINKNKTYPNTARRRNIQGEVNVKFEILASGNVNNIQIIKGKSIFKKSIYNAIEDSFPMKIDKTLFNFPKEFSLSVNYILK